jgi:hypothetical protein
MVKDFGKMGTNFIGVSRRQQNEEVTFWNNTFGVGICISYFNDGRGRYKH